jgi:hypothetical protein
LVHASQHAPGGTDELYALTRGHYSTSRLDAFPRTEIASNSLGTTSGHVQLTFFTAPPGYSGLTTIAIVHNGASSGLTLARMGLYSIDASENGTLIARTANDPTIGGAAAVPHERVFDPTGGFLSSWTPTPGQRYAWSFIYVGTTPGAHLSRNLGNSAVAGTSANAGRPRLYARITGQTDLPASFLAASLDASGAGSGFYGYFR